METTNRGAIKLGSVLLVLFSMVWEEIRHMIWEILPYLALLILMLCVIVGANNIIDSHLITVGP